MIKLGETSLLEFPVRALTVFPIVKKRYGGSFKNATAYEHVWTGIICTLIFCCLSIISKWFLFGILIPFIASVVIKEIIMDAKKRVNEYEMDSFVINLIERISGFVFASPFIFISLLR